MDTFYAHVVRLWMRELGRLWLERIDSELWKFSHALHDWLYTLEAGPRGKWRDQLDAFLSRQRAAGFELTPESRRDLERYLEDWAGESAEPTAAAAPVARGAGAAIAMLSQPIDPPPTISPPLPDGPPLPPRRGRFAPRQKVRLASDDEVLFYRKLQEAKRHLEALERTLAPITRKLNAAGLEEEIELTDELDEIEGLIWEHNDALEVARDAWLRGDLGSKAFDQLMLMSSPAAFGLPLFVDQDQAKRAQQQSVQIGKRLKQRIAFFDNVILAMQVMEKAGLAASLVLGPGLALKAAVAVSKVAVAKTVVKIGVGWVATQVAGKVIDETLRAVGVEDETIEHVQVAAEIITWLLFARRVHKGRLKKKVESKTEAPAAESPGPAPSRQPDRVGRQVDVNLRASSVTVADAKLIRGTNRSRLTFEGMEVRAVRDLDHLPESTLKEMARNGFAPRDKNGVRIHLHHHLQNPAGPLIEIPKKRHLISNSNQHPFGNRPGAGLSALQRKAFDTWRTRYWKARAKEELLRRGVFDDE